ncbi:MAG: methionine--tRNA ligase [Phycisphaerales bacterium]
MPRRTITTPIYYVNDRPHIGHAYTTTLCDVWARAMRLRGEDVFFLTGTDEHGIKVEHSAEERGMSPKALADENAAEFRRVLGVFRLTNDDFIRTTDPRHERQVQAFVQRLLDAGHVYLGEFEGWYDEGQEEYHTDTKAKELEWKSPVTGRPLVRAKEKNYYFRLSAFQAALERLFAEQPEFVRPAARRNEVLGRLRDGLQDVPMTRTNFSWGIPFPGHNDHVIYVWIDALFNYVTALGLADDAAPAAERVDPARKAHWPADYHVIGKEILWFHAIIWPAILMALDLPLPRCIYAHSFWISNGQKMSKSLGNFVDLPTIEGYFQRYGVDAWRWFMVTRGPLGATDADFRADAFHDTYTSELVNTVGNCASRVTAMLGKYFDGAVPEDPERGGEWPARVAAAAARWSASLDSFALADAAAAPLDLLRQVDAFINTTEPFKLAKDPAQAGRLAAILAQCAEVVRAAGVMLEPFLPERMEELGRALGQAGSGVGTTKAAAPASARLQWGGLRPGTQVRKVALFPRVEQAAASDA